MYDIRNIQYNETIYNSQKSELFIQITQMQNPNTNHIQQNYDQKALDNKGNVLKREQRNTWEINSFNNWIKSVLMNVYSQEMCKKVQKQLDLKKGDKFNKILHVLDVGCGRGQDILKWRVCRVNYMLASDFSSESLKQYQRKWRDMRTPYRLHTIASDFTKKDLYNDISHSFYDMVSAQFCFHYMFGSEQGLKNGLATIFSNLLIDGVFIATIPDGYTILKKVNQKGKMQADGSVVYGNKYFSVKFKDTKFTKPFGNVYGFYLEDAVGSKNQQTGQIQYVQEWLIPLDVLENLLADYGVVIDTTMNFIQFYMKYRDQYKELFGKFKLNYQPGKHMDPQCWEIGHLYRVLVCRKVSKGKRISQFNLGERRKAATKQIQRYQNSNRDRSRDDQRNQSYPKHDNNRNDRQDSRYNDNQRNYQRQDNRQQYDNRSRNDSYQKHDHYRNDRRDRNN